MTELNSEVDPDGPSDFFYPFSDLRLVDNAGLRVSRELFDALATLNEQGSSSYAATVGSSIGALAWAVRELEIQACCAIASTKSVPHSSPPACSKTEP